MSYEYVWFDGSLIHEKNATVSIDTHAIHYGTSIFEGIRGYWNGSQLNIFRLRDHVKRFKRSGAYYSISSRYTDAVITKAILDVCKKNNIKKSCYIRPFYFVGRNGIKLHLTKKSQTHTAVFIIDFEDLFDKKGISMCISKWRKFSSLATPTQAKAGGNYLNSIIATIEAKSGGYDDAVLLDHNGHVSEATGENIFVVKNGKISTPHESSSPLLGITRDTVKRMSKDLGIVVSERKITTAQLKSADEVFLSGTASEIIPVTKINDKKISKGTCGSITKTMMDEYEAIVNDKRPKYSRWLYGVY
ncbi:MAG: branched-chain amino acid aminotransferase [Cenarchaeum symbiont of Oopsacas minuta]|nr:branched-chain amino acid aminotransferase [Cenarchaeum symbiont of Oopsacas minuta]